MLINKILKQEFVAYCENRLQIGPEDIGAIIPSVHVQEDKYIPGVTVRFVHFDVFDINLKHRAIIRASHLKKHSA